MNKGRPEGSIVRNRIINILKQIGISYGYELYNLYKELFGQVHMRTIYYNLKKGIEKDEIMVVDVATELGNYSWGDEVQKVYYTTGPFAKTTVSKKDLELINSLKLRRKELSINWKKEIKRIVDELKDEVNNYNEKKDKLSNQNKKIIKQKIEEKKRKIEEYSKGKISKKDLSKMIKGINPDTL